MMNVRYDMAAMDDGATRIVHVNGRTMELAGEQADGEWFAHEAGDDGECFAQGFYMRDEDTDEDVMQDAEGNELARVVGEDALLAWAETVLG